MQNEFSDNDSDGVVYYENSEYKPQVIGKSAKNEIFEFFTCPRGEFSEMPKHQEYLADCLLLSDVCYSNIAAIVTEKYADYAMVYLVAPARRPALIYRSCVRDFDAIQLGSWLNVTACLLGMPDCDGPESRDERFYNLYCSTVEPDISESLPKPEIKDGVKVFLNDVQVSFTETSSIKSCIRGWVLYADFGAILIPDKCAPILSKLFLYLLSGVY
jgi:hypothetical protein